MRANCQPPRSHIKIQPTNHPSSQHRRKFPFLTTNHSRYYLPTVDDVSKKIHSLKRTHTHTHISHYTHKYIYTKLINTHVHTHTSIETIKPNKKANAAQPCPSATKNHHPIPLPQPRKPEDIFYQNKF